MQAKSRTHALDAKRFEDTNIEITAKALRLLLVETRDGVMIQSPDGTLSIDLHSANTLFLKINQPV